MPKRLRDTAQDTMHFSSKKNPLFFIAEIGGNHEGDFEYAKRLVGLAVEAGADAIKFQIYSGNSLVSRIESPERRKHFKKFELSNEQYIQLADICRDSGVLFMASIWDLERLALMDAYMTIQKIGSGDVTAYPIIEKLVSTGKPIIMSTGLCTLEEVKETISFIDDLDSSYLQDRKLALLQCTASYPTPDQEVNLDAMVLLRETFGLPVGYSDHTIGNDAVWTAAALGAEIIEMHFTDTRKGKRFRDHKIAITKEEIKLLLDQIKRIKTLKGSYEKRPTQSEIRTGHLKSFRRSVYARRAIRKGEVLSEENLIVLRPEHGIPARRFREILGRISLRDIKEHEVIRDVDIGR